jgi:hypothetical protein
MGKSKEGVVFGDESLSIKVSTHYTCKNSVSTAASLDKLTCTSAYQHNQERTKRTL